MHVPRGSFKNVNGEGNAATIPSQRKGSAKEGEEMNIYILFIYAYRKLIKFYNG